jgi:hypothetical protein
MTGAPPLMPWHAPMPVASSDFVPLEPRLASYNVSLALGDIGTYRYVSRARVTRDLAYGDFQTNLEANITGRLGSGRAARYRGKYLKGIGRTTMAANWNRFADRNNNCGSLYPSFAIRELLVSTYLDARGARDVIVPCEGLLLRPRDPALISHFDRRVRPIDQRFQAISVKPAGFGRFSNLVWLAHHVDYMRHIGNAVQLSDFFACLLRTVDPTRETAPEAVTPEHIARTIEEAFARVTGAYRRAWQHGVYFLYPHNNFSADGRVCDIESHWILGGPIVAMAASRRDFGFFTPVMAFKQCRTFLHWLDAWLGYVASAPAPVLSGHRAFAAAVRGALRERFGPPARYLTDRAIGARLAGWARDELALDRAETRQVADATQGYLEGGVAGLAGLTPRRTKLPGVGNLGRGRRLRIDCLVGPPPDADVIAEVRALEAVYDELEWSTGDVEDVLGLVRGAVAQVRRIARARRATA